MTFTIWLSLFSICLLGAMSPGPSLLLISKHALVSRTNGLAAAWAHAFGIGLYALVTMLGLAAVLAKFPMVFTGISYAGALFLAYLGVNALRSKGGVMTKLEAGKKECAWRSAREGFLMAILSPKVMLFFTALFSQFVALSDSLQGQLTLVLTPFLTDAIWFSLLTFMLAQPRLIELLRSKARVIDGLSGIVLIGLALRVAWVA